MFSLFLYRLSKEADLLVFFKTKVHVLLMVYHLESEKNAVYKVD